MIRATKGFAKLKKDKGSRARSDVCVHGENGGRKLTVYRREGRLRTLLRQRPQFLKWATNLFLHNWNQGNLCRLTK